MQYGHAQQVRDPSEPRFVALAEQRRTSLSLHIETMALALHSALVLVLAASSVLAVPSFTNIDTDKKAFSALAHGLLGVTPGTSPVDDAGIPIMQLSTVGASSATPSQPLHVRVAYGTRPQTEAHFSWTSFDGDSPAAVLVGTHSGDYDLESVAASAPLTYGPDDGCGKMKAWTDPGALHKPLPRRSVFCDRDSCVEQTLLTRTVCRLLSPRAPHRPAAQHSLLREADAEWLAGRREQLRVRKRAGPRPGDALRGLRRHVHLKRRG